MRNFELLEYLNGPYTNYIDTNIMNLKNLFGRIKREHMIGNDEFDEEYREVLTDEIEARYRQYNPGKDGALWGAWYKADISTDPFGITCKRTFTKQEIADLADLLIDASAPGEALGFALNIFTGLSVTEVMNAKWKDLLEAEEGLLIHTNGAFPMKIQPTEYDTRPRAVPVPERLAKALLERKALIEKEFDFPLETKWGTAKGIGDLFIACRGSDHASFSHILGLSAYARNLLRSEIGLDEMRMAFTTKDLLATPALYAYERSAAYYFGRRTFATELYGGGASQVAISWLMGHEVPEDEDGKRPDITDEDMRIARAAIEAFAGKDKD